MSNLRRPFQIIRGNVRVYLVLNAVVYGLLLIGMGAGLLFPELNAARVASLEEDGTADLVTALLENVWLFTMVILAVNVLRVCLLTIVLPSMIVPFAGLAFFAYQAFIVGVTLAPVEEGLGVGMIPHSLTILIELQAYVLVMLGAYLLGKAWLRPGTVGARNRRQGYVQGLRQVGWLGLPALALLIIGAVYEAFSIIYLLPLLLAG
ncbi:stage II sporulation protein M [Nocardiopsis sp. Huas11]|uniref:stage II sporulation protein M n=1 Tax=Nocardiopsis sp. Huas11 TaxID=2183912 RepID=UPI000EAB7E24|nr:stage II sporulation protein M [Nocardiopsis sp. Huas11]RKS08615.1 stage II sporulation protein M [Nocardiopsis sp. Huas11]